MAAAAHVLPLLTLEEYLHTSYDPDCEFVDGYLEERNVGSALHGLLQIQVGIWFDANWEQWNLRAISEQRTRVSKNRVRLPDVAIVPEDVLLTEDPRTTPPFIAIEILSPEDRMPRVILRLKDFVAMGVEHIWLLDPIDRVAYTYADGLHLVETERLEIDGSPVHLHLPTLFSSLDPRTRRQG